MKQPGAVFTNGPKVLVAFANRELRAVPLTWQHPCDETGEPIPLFERNAENRPEDGPDDGVIPDFSSIPPDQMGVAAYETTTEGTPITPVFPGTREGLFQLLQYCAVNRFTFADQQTDIEGWARILGLEDVLAGRDAA